MDTMAGVFWRATRKGIRLPLQNPGDIWQAISTLGLHDLPLAQYLSWTLGDLLRVYGLRNDKPLTHLLAMLIEDTVHSSVDEAPLINAALGVTIRSAGLSRAYGGMRGFWQHMRSHYHSLGGVLKVGCRVEGINGQAGQFTIYSRRGTFMARQIVSAIPVEQSARIAPPLIGKRLKPYLSRDANAYGGAVVVFLGVPDGQIKDRIFTHHQILHSYDTPFGNGNNMFISVSAPGDSLSAPPGYRAVMLSTHCALDDWENLPNADYKERKHRIRDRLISLAQQVYPELGEGASISEVGTPRTYERYVSRPRGAVGGWKQNLRNSNQYAIPHDLGPRGFWLAGDTTWPGLGTVACVLGSRIVAEGALRVAEQLSRRFRFARSIRGSQKNPECPPGHHTGI